MSLEKEIQQSWKRIENKHHPERHLVNYNSNKVYNSFKQLYEIIGEEPILTSLERNPFFATRSLAMIGLLGKNNLKTICDDVSEILPKETLAKAFKNRSRDTIIALSLIYQLGRDQDNELVFSSTHNKIKNNFKQWQEDFIDNPVDCILGYSYALENVSKFNQFMEKELLQLKPSEVFNLSYEKYPELKSLHVPKEIKFVVDQAYLFYQRPKEGENKPLNVIQNTIEQHKIIKDENNNWQGVGDPNWLGVRLWKQCPQRCVYCDVPLDPDSLPANILLEKTAHVIKEITHNGNRKGVFLGISGGEPTLFGGRYDHLKQLSQKKHNGTPLETKDVKDLVSLIYYAKEHNMFVAMNTTLVPVGKPTNAKIMLRGEKLAEYLVSSGIDRLNVSLESHNPGIHDQTTRLENSWNYTKLGIRLIEKYEKRLGREVNIVINHVVTNKNYQDLPKLIKFAGEYLPGIDDVNPLPIKDEENKHLFLDRENINNYQDNILPKMLELSQQYEYPLLRVKSQQIFGNDDKEMENATNGIYHHWPEGLPCHTAKVSTYIDYAGRISLCSYNADAKLPEYFIGSVMEVPEVSLNEIRNRQINFINDLPCGELCTKHCGPDLLRMNKRIEMEILNQDRRGEKRK